MQTITIDGKEYVLVPKEQLQPVEQPAPSGTETPQDAEISPLNDFMMDAPIAPTETHPDDGLATQDEKTQSIRVTQVPETPQETVVSSLPSVPAAQPKKYLYRERFVNKELTAADVVAMPTYHRELLASNPEDPMIQADKRKPKELRLFYGPGTEQE